MALTTAFLNTCRTAIGSIPELTAFRTARHNSLTATRANRIAAWHAAHSPTTAGPSPAYNLRRAIRDVVNARADAAGTLGPLERESAYATLAAEFVPEQARPMSDAEEAAALETLLRQEQLS